MSDNKIQAIKALNKAQKEMGKALKNATNPHFRSSYADLQSVVEAVMPAFLANGFAVTQPNGGMAGIAPEDDDGNAAVATSKNKKTISTDQF